MPTTHQEPKRSHKILEKKERETKNQDPWLSFKDPRNCTASQWRSIIPLCKRSHPPGTRAPSVNHHGTHLLLLLPISVTGHSQPEMRGENQTIETNLLADGKADSFRSYEHLQSPTWRALNRDSSAAERRMSKKNLGFVVCKRPARDLLPLSIPVSAGDRSPKWIFVSLVEESIFLTIN